jgi:transposase
LEIRNKNTQLMQAQVKQKLFEGQSFFVGIDVHKKSWKVTILGEQYEYKTFSQDPKPDLLAAYLNRTFPNGNFYAVYEAGFSGFTACRELKNLGINCEVIHPADVPTSQKEKEQKTDAVDSRKLARILRSKEFNPIHLPDIKLEADRSLIRLRTSLVKDISRIKNRVKSLLFQFGIDIPERFTTEQTRHWSKVYIEWLHSLESAEQSIKDTLESYIRSGQVLRRELLEVNKKIRLLSQSESYRENIELMISIPGVGLITAMLLLTQIGDISRFKKEDELCAYVGLIPKMHGSGDRMITGKITRRGIKELKIALIEISWIAVRKDPALMLKFNQLILTMPKNKAIIRIARKILNRIRYVLRTKNQYVISTIE